LPLDFWKITVMVFSDGMMEKEYSIEVTVRLALKPKAKA
jgi:hypothetical protein